MKSTHLSNISLQGITGDEMINLLIFVAPPGDNDFSDLKFFFQADMKNECHISVMSQVFSFVCLFQYQHCSSPRFS